SDPKGGAARRHLRIIAPLRCARPRHHQRICRCRRRLSRPGRNRHGQCGPRPACATDPNGGVSSRQGVEMASGEDRLIDSFFRPLAHDPAALGLGDDAALLTPTPGTDLVATADGVIEGVHFLPDDPPDAVAKKALRANLSDLAAKGAEPVGFLLSIALPEKPD